MTSWGFFAEVSTNATAAKLSPEALKVNYSRFEAFAPVDEGQWPFFPYRELRAFEASEVAAGRDPIFMTATYMGKRRPLLFSWDLALVNGKPTMPASNWHYAVNVGDVRYQRFWLNNYFRGIVYPTINRTTPLWVGQDETAITPGVFGVLDDNNNFVSNVQWDQPFPQGGQAWMNAVQSFIDYVHVHGPEIKIIPNLGSMFDPNQFGTILANAPGIIIENAWDGPAPIAYTRNQRVTTFANYTAWGAAGKVEALRMWVAQGNATQLQTAFALYNLVKGANFFWIPMYSGTLNGVPPSLYRSWQAMLGNPIGPYTSQPQPGMRPGYNLYSRQYDGGTVYLNWSGVTQVVTLPANAKYYDPNGNPITQVSIPDGVGTFVSTAAVRAARPQISPRSSGSITGPVTVSITCDAPGAIIHYTTDGSTPTAQSPTYNAPFQLFGNATVKAIASFSGSTDSALATASYAITSGLPTVGIYLSPERGPAGTAYPVVALSAMSLQPVTVNYTYRGPNGVTGNGTATIIAGNRYALLPVPASYPSGSIVIVHLTGAVGADLGSSTVYNYDIQ